MMPRSDKDYALSDAKKRAYREAMLSVYYHSLGRQWQQQGAPAVFLPPSIQPLGLAAALERLSESPPRLDDAIWRVIRSVPVRQSTEVHVEKRYPKALLGYLPDGWLADVDKLRRQYRTGANVYAAALDLLGDGDVDGANGLVEMLQRKRRGIGTAAGDLFKMLKPVTGFDALVAKAKKKRTGAAQDHLAEFEATVGSPSRTFVMNFADASAFNKAGSPTAIKEAGGTAAKEQELTDTGEPKALKVYPVCSVVTQDTTTLSTTATVTTVVDGPFELVAFVIDPRNWPESSDVITHTRYVTDAYNDVEQEDIPDYGSGFAGSRLLHEKAAISWGANDDQQGEFDVILNITFDVAEPEIHLRFTLGRSISSSILWDRRPGGLRIDNGFVKVRGIGADSWLMTSRKTVKFADRTPNLNRAGWADTGQLLNYLAPASLTWWIESEAFSMGSTAYLGKDGHDNREQAQAV